MLGKNPSAAGENSSNTVPTLTISIHELLQNIKDYSEITSILSKDVTDFLGIDRPESPFTGSLRYSYGEGSFTDAYREYLEKKYSYEALTQKPDMKVTMLTEKPVVLDTGRIDRAATINKGLKSLIGKDNGKNAAGRHYVYVNDIGEYASVNRKAFEHGLSRQANATAYITSNLGSVLENSIKINELEPRNETVLSSYILLGAARDENGTLYPVRFVVNEYPDGLSEITGMDVIHALYAAKAKKIEPAANAGATTSQKAGVPSGSVISIRDLLENIKGDELAASVLSNDVLAHLGIDRPESPFTGSLRYSYGEGSFTDTYREYLEKKYSYEALTQKPDMKVTRVDPVNVPLSRADAVRKAKQNAAGIGRFNEKDGNVSVYVDDINTNVILSTAGLRHGLDRRFSLNAPVVVQAGEILKHSIRINELNPRDESISGAYILVGMAKNQKNEAQPVIFVVNRYTNETIAVDVLYSMNSKTKKPEQKKGTSRELIPKVSQAVRLTAFLVPPLVYPNCWISSRTIIQKFYRTAYWSNMASTARNPPLRAACVIPMAKGRLPTPTGSTLRRSTAMKRSPKSRI